MIGFLNLHGSLCHFQKLDFQALDPPHEIVHQAKSSSVLL